MSGRSSSPRHAADRGRGGYDRGCRGATARRHSSAGNIGAPGPAASRPRSALVSRPTVHGIRQPERGRGCLVGWKSAIQRHEGAYARAPELAHCAERGRGENWSSRPPPAGCAATARHRPALEGRRCAIGAPHGTRRAWRTACDPSRCRRFAFEDDARFRYRTAPPSPCWPALRSWPRAIAPRSPILPRSPRRSSSCPTGPGARGCTS